MQALYVRKLDPDLCVHKEVVVVFLVVVSNLYSHDSQWPIRDNSVREEKE